jgi:hypothetical protein
MSQLGSKTVLTAPKRHFRSTPNNGHRQTAPTCLKHANLGNAGCPDPPFISRYRRTKRLTCLTNYDGKLPDGQVSHQVGHLAIQPRLQKYFA